MCIVNKYANIYLQKVYIVMSCLGDFLKLVDWFNVQHGFVTCENDVCVRARGKWFVACENMMRRRSLSIVLERIC